MKLTVLAGGVGAARFLDGLVQVVPREEIVVIGNVGDDFEHLGLHVSPDLDTILYTLAELVHEGQGWGRRDETASALDTVRRLGGPDWFFLGDRDIGLHLVRTERLRRGAPLSSITRDFAERLGIGVRLLPATDDPVRTRLRTHDGWLDFQTYFVRRRHSDEVLEIEYQGVFEAVAAPGVVKAIDSADAVIFAPSNPYLSIDPITMIGDVGKALGRRSGPTLAISPIVGGRALKGPADALMRSFVSEASASKVVDHYVPYVSHVLIDTADAHEIPAIVDAFGVRVEAADIVMRDRAARARVAQRALSMLAA